MEHLWSSPISGCIQIKQLPSIQIKQMLSCRKYRTDASKCNDASKSSDFDHATAATPQEHMEIELTRLMDTTLPHKIWLKQQFSIGVNEVTRVLERMPPIDVKGSSPGHPLTTTRRFCCKASPVEIQAILVASDCIPQWLTRHLPTMAFSRKVPLIVVMDKKGGSTRLGELVKLKTAIAIGVKAKGNAINRQIDEILQGKLGRIV
ncbi:hypothetical protein RHMOL_Rhmol01G0386800 [Rhododendron molle]|uniref:Uncharacterized protein n=1 Tax=Rhododendron molle TaxID=49168 RepID=A0ACC0QDR0_RHOML|nr:hypothetical protein RHMOL_Rhmol01G0386800 [Rhododendron molle]